MFIWDSLSFRKMKGYSRNRQQFLELLYAKYFTMEEEFNWCLGIGKAETDFQLCKGDSELLPKLYKKDEIRFQYNQYKYEWSYVSCTIFAAVGMASDLTNYEFSYDEIKDVDDSSYDNSEWDHIRKRWEWAYVSDAVNHMRRWWNSNKKLVEKHWKIASYCISKYNDDIIENAINNLYTIDWNYCPTTKYNEDKQDLMIDGTDFWKKTNWHSVDIICYNWQRSVKDSWSNPAKNIYWLKHKLSEITNYWSWFYIYTLVREDAYEEIKRLNEFKTALLLDIEQNSKLWHLTNDKKYKDALHNMNIENRKKLEDIETELKKYV